MNSVKNLFYILAIGGFLLTFQTDAYGQWFTNGATTVYTWDNAGVGTSAPTQELHVVKSGSNADIRVQRAGESFCDFYSGTNTNGAGLWNYGNRPLKFATNATERLHISGTGMVGIGRTPSSNYKLDVALSSGQKVRFGSGETIEDGGSYTLKTNASIQPLSNNSRYLGSATLAWRNVYSYNFTTASDKRLKNNVRNLDYGLKEIMKLRPVSYVYNDDQQKGTHLGLIAQEIQEVMEETVVSEELVTTESGETTMSKTDYLGVNYIELIPVLINGIQEQQALIVQQNERISRLEKQLASADEMGVQTKQVKDALQTANAFQINPNPFNTESTVAYELADNVSTATLVMSDMQGRTIKEIALPVTAKGNVAISAADLPTGTYTYSLIVDGKIVTAKKVVIAK